MNYFFSETLGRLPLASVSVDARMSLGQDIVYQSVGIVVVIGSLATIALILVGLNRILRGAGLVVASGGRGRQAAGSSGAPVVSSQELAGLSPDLRAAIAAAVYTTLGPSHQIVEIHPSLSPQIMAWSMEGRRQIFQSHRVR